MKRQFLIIVVLFLFALVDNLRAQQRYTFGFYQKLDRQVYNRESRLHSSLKPYLIKDSLLNILLDSLLQLGVDTNRRTWVERKLFNEHLIDIKRDDYTAYFDFLPDFIIGRADGKTTWLNTRGFQIGGSIGKKFHFYTSAYENQGEFANYYEDYIQKNKVIPGQLYDRAPGESARDWSYATALLSYTPTKYLDITLGQDKNFIGDGYRSMLLSDYASNYPFLKLTAHLGNVQYMAMWASMQEAFRVPQFSYDSGNRKKGAVIHYLDWNVNNRLSLGFFDAIIWSQYDDAGNKRGFDWGYVNPLIFLRPIEAMSGSPDNAAMGLNVKYELLNKTAVYGQFFLDEFEAKSFFSNSGSYRNKWGGQLGFRGSDLFGINRLNYLAEFNTAKPHTYSSRTANLAYGHYSEPLAHPFGANFRELLGIVSYSVRRFDFRMQGVFARYGLDPSAETNYGKDIYKPYNTATVQTGNNIGQGNSTSLKFVDSRVSYLINPSYNLRFELGSVLRSEKQSSVTHNTNWITFGLRSSFRNLYQDF